MARKPRLFVPGATYHVYWRVACGEFVFDDPQEAEEFVVWLPGPTILTIPWVPHRDLQVRTFGDSRNDPRKTTEYANPAPLCHLSGIGRCGRRLHKVNISSGRTGLEREDRNAHRYSTSGDRYQGVAVAFSASKDEIAAALAYDELHVPALFRQWAPIVVDAAQIGRGTRVLDIACGTGVLTREAALRSGGDGEVSGVDISRGMLAVASQRAPDIDWQNAPAESLPFETDAFDAVISQFGLMFFQDRTAALREMMRVLTPGGRLAVAVWASLDESEAYPIEVALLDRLAGRNAADALRAPFVLGETNQLTDLFLDAGITSVGIKTHYGRARFPSLRSMVEADLRGWLPVMGVILSEEIIERILDEAEQVLADYVTPEGRVEFDSPAHIVTGQKA